MSEKLDLFEMTIKRGLENYELPLDTDAWNNFKGNLGSGANASGATGGASFLGKFGVAAAVITAVGIFINYNSSSEFNIAQGHDSEVIEYIGEGRLSGETKTSDDTKLLSASNADTDIVITGMTQEEMMVRAENLKNLERSEALAITEKEKEAITKINEKLQRGADKVGATQADLEKQTTTRYVGKGFNLGATSEFTPNADGVNDTFLPSALERNDQFLMTISTTEGKVIFVSNSIDKPWDGSDLTGKAMNVGHYSWEVTLSKDINKEIFRGVVRLER